MALTESQKELAKQYFEAYPTEDVLHIAFDGNVFLNSGKHDAQNHQKSIAPGEPLLTVTRKACDDNVPEFSEETLSPEEKEAFDNQVKEIIEEEEQEEEEVAADTAEEQAAPAKGKKKK